MDVFTCCGELQVGRVTHIRPSSDTFFYFLRFTTVTTGGFNIKKSINKKVFNNVMFMYKFLHMTLVYVNVFHKTKVQREDIIA